MIHSWHGACYVCVCVSLYVIDNVVLHKDSGLTSDLFNWSELLSDLYGV